MIILPNQPVSLSTDQTRFPGTTGTAFSRPTASPASISPASSNSTTSLALAAQIQNLDRSQDNVSQAVSFTQTQDAYLQIVGNTLNRMSDLAQLAQDPSTTETDRTDYQSEFSRLQAVIANAASKDFNGESLFSGNALTVALDPSGQTLTLPGADLSGDPYAAVLQTNLQSPSDASAALSKVQLTITQLSLDHAGIGASQSELNAAADRLAVSRENLTALTTTIPDANAAAASVQIAGQQIVAQPGAAMLAQANALPQSALRLAP